MNLFCHGFLVLNIIFSSIWYHPVHFSVTNVEYNKDKQGFEIVLKLFKSDLETALSLQYGLKFADADKNVIQADPKILQQYIDLHFKIRINGKGVNVVYRENKVSGDDIWLYADCKYKKKVQELAVDNSLITEVYDDQTNLLILGYMSQQNGIRLDKTNTNFRIKVDQDRPEVVH